MSGTSTKAGYLTPTVAGGQAPYDQELEDIIHDIIMGITSLPPQYIRPFFQDEPPVQPPAYVDWIAFNITTYPITQYPQIEQLGSPPGDTLSMHEDIKVLTSSYGPNAGRTMAILRAGLYIAQNRDMIKAALLNFVDTAPPLRIPDLVNVQFINRIDMTINLRRKTSNTYAVQPLDQTQLANNPIISIEE
jgi:hypothetical protein